MLAIAGQTAGPNWLTFFRKPMAMGTHGGTKGKQIRFLFFKGSVREKLKTYVPKNGMSIQTQKVATYDLDHKKINLILNKSFKYCNLKSSIIFQRIRILMIFHNIFDFFLFYKFSLQLVFTTALDFRTLILENIKMSSSL